MNDRAGKYEENYKILEQITESLNKDEIGIDDLVEKTKEALGSANICMDILKKQKGEFKKLERDFGKLLEDSDEEKPETPEENSNRVGEDAPF